MRFSCSWNFPKPDRLFMREEVFSFFSEHGVGENTEAEQRGKDLSKPPEKSVVSQALQ